MARPVKRQCKQVSTLTALSPSRVGRYGALCHCGERMEFTTIDGVAYESCSTHGRKPTPRTKRCRCLHDQRQRLLTELAKEVRSETTSKLVEKRRFGGK